MPLFVVVLICAALAGVGFGVLIDHEKPEVTESPPHHTIKTYYGPVQFFEAPDGRTCAVFRHNVDCDFPSFTD